MWGLLQVRALILFVFMLLKDELLFFAQRTLVTFFTLRLARGLSRDAAFAEGFICCEQTSNRLTRP